MSWQDRLVDASYTSPSGVETAFLYEDVSVSFDKKTSAYDFPDADGTYVQDNGKTSRQIPMRAILSGADYDQVADAFLESLGERGIGRLSHPNYGTIDVVPFGTVTRRDDLTSAAGQAVFEIVFFETNGLIYPIAQIDPASAVAGAIGDFNIAVPDVFERILSIQTAIERVAFENVYFKQAKLIVDTLGGLSQQAPSNITDRFELVKQAIFGSIEELVSKPKTLAAQFLSLIQIPAKGGSGGAIDSYQSALDDTIGGELPTEYTNTRDKNEFFGAELTAIGCVSGAVVAVINQQFETKPQALTAADQLLTMFDSVATWRDDNYALLTDVDTGEGYQALLDAVAIAAGFLVEISFSLKQERRIVIDRDRTIIDLAAELYGEIDTKLDFLIQTNRLSGDEILELKRGREIVYYV